MVFDGRSEPLGILLFSDGKLGNKIVDSIFDNFLQYIPHNLNIIRFVVFIIKIVMLNKSIQTLPVCFRVVISEV